MKRALSLLLVLVLCLSLLACNKKEANDPTESDPTSAPQTDPGFAYNTNTEGLLSGTDIDVSKLQEFIQIVELTTNNWKEHFKVYHYTYSYDEDQVNTDDFGEIVSTQTVTHTGEGHAFGAGNEKYHWYNEIVMELKNTKTGEVSVYKFGPFNNYNDMSVSEDFRLEDYECTRIQGKLCYFTFPIGTLPPATYIWPALQSGKGIPPGALFACPGTNAVTNTYMTDWLN